MSYNELKIKSLPASAVINNFVEGITYSNYEIYLIELLNNSTHFLTKGKSAYCAPLSEEKAQLDANAKAYEIDFKLLASQTMFRAKSSCEPKLMIDEDGLVFEYINSKSNRDVIATKLHVLLRTKTIEDLFKIDTNCVLNKINIDNDLAGVLNIAKTKKNVLFFFPYILFYDVTASFDDVLFDIHYAIQQDFSSLMKYRTLNTAGYDTYLTLLHEEEFLIFQFVNDKFVYIENISTDKTPTFQKLMQLNLSY